MSYGSRVAEYGIPLSFEQIACTDTAVNPTVPVGAIGAVVSVDGISCRYRTDGTAATSSVGHLLADGQFIELGAADLADLSVITSDDTGPATVNITYYRS